MRFRLNHHRRVYLAAILTVSVLLRLAVALYLGNVVDAPEQLTDQRSYDGLGARLIEGHGFSFAENWYPFTKAEEPTSHWSFLYSLFVAGVYAVTGAHPVAARLVQAVLGGLLLPWMVYRLTRTIFAAGSSYSEQAGEIIPLVAALIAAIYPYFLLYAATLMTETFFIAVVLWTLERGLAMANLLRDEPDRRPLWSLGLTLGVGLGLATLLRQSILPWVPVLFLYQLWLGWRTKHLRATILALGLAGLILMAFILPWTLRNYLVYDSFLLLNSNAGYAMYSAQHPMHGTSFREFDAAPLLEGSWGLTEPELDRLYMREGFRFIMEDPSRYLLLSLSRVRAFLEFWPTPDTSLLHNIGRSASFGLLLPLLLYGLVLVVRRPGFVKRNALLFLFAAFYAVLHLLTWAMVRYRLPVDAALTPLAALAVADLFQRARTAMPNWVS